MTEKKTAKKPIAKKKRAPAPTARKNPSLRDKINVLALIDALESHILGRTEMTSTQVSAALALLKKILPDVADPARDSARKSGAENKNVSHEDALKELE